MVFYFNGSRVDRLGEPVVLQPHGQRVKRYRLERRLGQGGMGVVYAAWDEKEKRRVAIKSIKLDEMDEDGEMLRRFKNEAKNVARLHHPNIVHIYSEDGLDLEQINRVILPYMVMEYAEGGDLQERLKALGAERLYPLKRTLHLFEQLCYAIEHMHQRNIIHRDLKPSNVLFKSADKENDELMLGDFGLSIHEDASLISYPTAGTPAYRAPEQAFGDAKKESDIFSLGILLYQLCTGRFPFNPYGRTYPPPKPSSVNSALPLALDAVLLKALHEHPAQRFSTASEFLAQVSSAIEDVPMPVHLARSSALSQSNIIYPNARPNSREFVARPAKAIAQVPAPVVADFNSVEPSNTAKVVYANGRARSGIPHRTVGRAKTLHKYPRSYNGRLLFLLSGLLLAALLLSYIAFAYLQPTSFARVIHAFSPNFTGVATVTIMPDNQTVAHSYVFSGVTGTPDPSQRQVKAFPLSETPTAKSATVAATGRKDTVASPAKGILSFINGGGAPYTFGIKTPITSSGGIVVFLDAPVIIPASNPVAGTFGKATGTATASTTGANTNIPSGGINTSASGNVVTIMNHSAFSGGRDDAHYNFVQQSDIDTAAQPLQASLTQDAQNNLKTQLTTGKALASGTQCTSTVTADHAAGDKSTNVTITVSVTCAAVVYDEAGLQSLATTLLRQQVDQDPALGKEYQLQGQVVTDTSIDSIKNGTVFLSVNSKGLYAYAGLDAQKSQLANLIKGKTADQAVMLLKSQGHVKDVSLPDRVTTLPTDVSQIIIVIQMPQDFSGGGTTTGGNPNPAPTTVTGNS